MENKTVLISIHPHFAEKIISGEKKLEFRRRWAVHPVDMLVIYATAPVKKIVAVASVHKVIIESPTKLWDLCQKNGGGISRRSLFAYLEGKRKAVAIELKMVVPLKKTMELSKLLDGNFRPPQSFCYLKPKQRSDLNEFIKGK